jgi:hypothetical protein
MHSPYPAHHPTLTSGQNLPLRVTFTAPIAAAPLCHASARSPYRHATVPSRHLPLSLSPCAGPCCFHAMPMSTSSKPSPPRCGLFTTSTLGHAVPGDAPSLGLASMHSLDIGYPLVRRREPCHDTHSECSRGHIMWASQAGSALWPGRGRLNACNACGPSSVLAQ